MQKPSSGGAQPQAWLVLGQARLGVWAWAEAQTVRPGRAEAEPRPYLGGAGAERGQARWTTMKPKGPMGGRGGKGPEGSMSSQWGPMSPPQKLSAPPVVPLYGATRLHWANGLQSNLE